MARPEGTVMACGCQREHPPVEWRCDGCGACLWRTGYNTTGIYYICTSCGVPNART